MNKEFVTYEQASALKELGFNEPCFAIHSFVDGELNFMYVNSFHSNDDVNELSAAAPTYSQAFRFFREKYKLHSSVYFQKLKESDIDEDIELYEFIINEQWQIGKEWYDYSYGFKHHSVSFNYISYEEAESACLDRLIKIKNEG